MSFHFTHLGMRWNSKKNKRRDKQHLAQLSEIQNHPQRKEEFVFKNQTTRSSSISQK